MEEGTAWMSKEIRMLCDSSFYINDILLADFIFEMKEMGEACYVLGVRLLRSLKETFGFVLKELY